MHQLEVYVLKIGKTILELLKQKFYETLLAPSFSDILKLYWEWLLGYSLKGTWDCGSFKRS